MNEPLRLRTRRPGDRITSGAPKKLKDLWIGRKTPRDQRERTPLIARGGDILWMLDEQGLADGGYPAAAGELLEISLWEENHGESECTAAGGGDRPEDRRTGQADRE